jgi:hypothetical protein
MSELVLQVVPREDLAKPVFETGTAAAAGRRR